MLGILDSSWRYLGEGLATSNCDLRGAGAAYQSLGWGQPGMRRAWRGNYRGGRRESQHSPPEDVNDHESRPRAPAEAHANELVRARPQVVTIVDSRRSHASRVAAHHEVVD